MIVAFLQNAWFFQHTPQAVIDRYLSDARYRALILSRSHTGKRLVRTFGAELFCSINWQESTNKIGYVSSAKFPADPIHIKEVLKELQPELVLAFGGVAGPALLRHWDGPIISLPHPSGRVITDALYKTAAGMINGHQGRTIIKQLKGRIEVSDAGSPGQNMGNNVVNIPS